MILKRNIPPSAKKLASRKTSAGHVRRTFSTLLAGNGEDIKTTQELMRHANPNITLICTLQAIPDRVREAQGKV